MHRSSTVYKRKQYKSKYVVGFLCERTTVMDVFTGGSVIMVYVFWPEATD